MDVSKGLKTRVAQYGAGKASQERGVKDLGLWALYIDARTVFNVRRRTYFFEGFLHLRISTHPSWL